jgi:hypothetical protein
MVAKIDGLTADKAIGTRGEVSDCFLKPALNDFQP